MVDKDEATAAPAPEGRAQPLEQALSEARAQIEELKTLAREQQLRSLAELENVRKRAEREAAQTAKFGVEKLASDLLGVCDSLELGLEAARKAGADAASIVEGMALTHKQLLGVLERHGVTAVDPQGQPFNPELHEAVSMVESADVAPSHVLSVMQKGYRLHERLLRPARVVVARAPAPPQGQGQ